MEGVGIVLWGAASVLPLALSLLKKGGKRSIMHDREYECIIVGAGLSGLNTAYELVHKHGVDAGKLLILDAQSYIGGRVKQTTSFVPGMTIDLGAEIIHGSCTALNKFAERIGEETTPVFVWAHGDGGPLEEPVNGGYGVYYLRDGDGDARLLRFDDEDEDFVTTNDCLHELGEIDPQDVPKSHSLNDYLRVKGIDPSGLMAKMVHAGFSNTMCTNNADMSLLGMVVWKKAWDMEDGDEADYRFKNSYKCVVDYFKKACQQVPTLLRHSVDKITYDNCPNGKVLLEVRGNDNVNSGDEDKGWGQSFAVTAKCAVVTVPLPVLAAGRVVFDPPLSKEERNDLYGSTQVFPAVKVLLSFNRRCWPAGLHGTIMAGDGVLVPEAWFREIDIDSDSKVEEKQPRCYATGFLTADFARGLEEAARIATKGRGVGAAVDEAMCDIFLRQLEDVFSLLRKKHMGAAVSAKYGDTRMPSSFSSPISEDVLPSPRTVYCAGMVYRWNQETHPFIRGGYSSVKAGAYSLSEEPRIVNQGKGNIFFAGEGTAVPGCTAHAALDTGTRAAGQVAALLAARK